MKYSKSNENNMAVPQRNEASWSSWRRRWKPDLKCQPWKNFKISGIAYIIKSHFTEADCSYEFCISDLKTVWYEKIDEKTFRNRSKKLNPNVEAKIGYLLKHVQANLEEQQMDTAYSLHQEDSRSDGKEIVLHLKSKLQAGVPFMWECHGVPDCQDLLAEHLIKPLFAMVTELGRRQIELQSLIRKKDLQIKDYKETGARLSRKSLETSQFDSDTFPTKMVLTKGFEESVEYHAERAFVGTGQELYKHIMIRKAWLDVKDSLLGPEQEAGESVGEMSGREQRREGEPLPEGVSSWTDRLPPSLVGDIGNNLKDSPTHSSPRITPLSSPVKSDGRISSPDVSPSKEMELQRRAALERKLAEEGEQARKSKKRRKINL